MSTIQEDLFKSDNNTLSRYKFVSREIAVNEVIRGKMRDTKVVTIGVLDKETDIVYPHPLSNFIKTDYEYNGGSINTQSAPAQVVCRFLNFVFDRIQADDEYFTDLRTSGISGLHRIHGSKFITSMSLSGLQKNTVHNYELYLTRFYIYLKKMGLTNEKFEVEVIERNFRGKKSQMYKSIFGDPQLSTRFPSSQTIKKRPPKSKDFGDRRRELTAHFIGLARDIAPEIALGLCFQFYGGLRTGEVVNLTRAELEITYRESMCVQIKDNRNKLFSRLKDTKFENPKRLAYLNLNLAKQTVMDNDLVWDIYDQHMKTLDILNRKGKLEVPSALFVDGNGFPMSGKVYERRFSKVKKAFLKSLIGQPEYNDISSAIWSTHIGRGVFTNTLIEMGLSVTQLAIARGDRNINSAMDYIDAVLSAKQIKAAVNEFKKHPVEDLGVIPKDVTNRFRKGHLR